MLTTEEKLRNFSQSVFAKAQKQADTALQAAKDTAKAQIEAFENRCLDEAYHVIQIQTRKIRRQAQENVPRQKLEARQTLFKSREAMVDQVFAEAEARLAAFRTESEYLPFIRRLIDKAEGLLGTKELVIVLDAADQPLLKELESAYPDASFSPAEAGQRLLGGIKATDTSGKRTVDFSLAALLREERTRFLVESGFTL